MSAPGEETFDDDRELCGDGSCLGIITDGKCNVCGLTGSGSGSASASATGAPRDPTTGQTGGHGPGLAANEGTSATAEEAFDHDDRQLCPDGACTGLLGNDGKCKECGRSAAS